MTILVAEEHGPLASGAALGTPVSHLASATGAGNDRSSGMKPDELGRALSRALSGPLGGEVRSVATSESFEEVDLFLPAVGVRVAAEAGNAAEALEAVEVVAIERDEEVKGGHAVPFSGATRGRPAVREALGRSWPPGCRRRRGGRTWRRSSAWQIGKTKTLSARFATRHNIYTAQFGLPAWARWAKRARRRSDPKLAPPSSVASSSTANRLDSR